MTFVGPYSTFAGSFAAADIDGFASEPDRPGAGAAVFADWELPSESDLLPESDFVASWTDTTMPITGITIPTTHQAHFG
ncbi:hypothetical protein ACU686_34740 [Yinghuangia aomiensis]